MKRSIWILAASLAAGCGGLGTPDLATGEVRGRIVGGTASGFVYPVGRPELKAPLAADGSFRVKAPAGAAELVLWDGRSDPASTIAPHGRAARLAVEVEAAEIVDVGDQEELPAARAILAGVRAESGAGCDGVRFRADLVLGATLSATDQDRTVVSGVASALLTPLPPGAYRLTISLDGFRTEVRDYDLSGEVEGYAEEFELEVDDDDDVRGCEVTGCDSGGLVCCRSGDAGCLVGRCHGGDTSAGSCGAACLEGGGCQAGLTCASAGSGAACLPPGGATCGSYLQTAGAACLSPDTCGALDGGTCEDRSYDRAGYCTAACAGDADCASFPLGWECDAGRCEPHD